MIRRGQWHRAGPIKNLEVFGLSIHHASVGFNTRKYTLSLSLKIVPLIAYLGSTDALFEVVPRKFFHFQSS